MESRIKTRRNSIIQVSSCTSLKNKLIQVPPMDMTTILTPPWPKSLSDFVVACLSWDPKKRPTSTQCLNHEYFKEVERYLPQREQPPGTLPCHVSNSAPPATMATSTPALSRKTSIKGLGIEIPLPPRGARQQPSYQQFPNQPYQELSHAQSTSQLQQVYLLLKANISRVKEDGLNVIKSEIHQFKLRQFRLHSYRRLISLRRCLQYSRNHRIQDSTVEWHSHHPSLRNHSNTV
jgi:serine/threonine protein kinase